MWRLAAVVAGTDNGNGVRGTVEAVHSNQDQIMLALIALVGTSIAALVFIIRNGRTAQTGADDAAVAARQATAANRAVNNVGPGKHNLYDMVEHIRDNVTDVRSDVHTLKTEQTRYDSHGWETLPADLGSAVALTTTIRELQNNHKSITEKLDTIISELRSHIGSHDHN